ncbi:odorant receptor 22c-like isoform X4 [Odontomachus brunneus]|uniref:odorant receptor 22c-like isoform X4 n=1 Tax=Odontomachus brunneus TaxID=486640 RepID=UPI0013F2B133|nr:odorant receptor 22c-like isoform X4 [Odontomachus brunneus]
MEFSWDCHYGVTKRLATLVGLWPYQNKREKILRMGVTITAALILNIPQICKFIHCDKDLHCIFGTVPGYLFVIVILLKIKTYILKSNRIKTLTDRVFTDWERLQSSQEYEIMKTYVGNARWTVCMYFALCFMGTAIFVFVSLVPHILDVVLPLNESRPIILPYEAYYFVDERKYFFYIFLQGSIALLIIVMSLVAYDTMFMSFVEHICSIFAVAGFRCEHLVNKDVDIVKIVNNDLGDMHNKRMARCVKVHWAALEFAEHLEDTFSIDFGIELVLVTIAMSITLYQVTLQSDDSLEALRYLIYVIIQFVHMFVFCWEGQRLIDHSLLIHDKIYSCSWYKKPAKSQRLIMHVLKRSLQPKFLSGGRMFIFSLQGFTTVVQTSMSYFTVLSSV